MNEEEQASNNAGDSQDDYGGFLAGIQQEQAYDPKKIAAARNRHEYKIGQKWSKIPLKDKLIIELTLGLVLIGGVTALIFLEQLSALQGQIQEMKVASGQTERLVILSVGQLIQSTRQTQTAADQLRRSERAMVVPDFSKGHLTPDAQGHLSFEVTLTNTGKTAAKHIHFVAIMDFIQRSDNPEFSYNPPHYADGWTIGVLYPGQTQKFSFFAMSSKKDKRIFTSAELNAISFLNPITLMYGKMTYSDVFKNEHWSTFCGVGSSNAPGTHASHKCVDYNDTDDN